MASKADKNAGHEKELDTECRCRHCNKAQFVNFATCLKEGWPECCGWTMQLILTKADIPEEICNYLDKKVPELGNIIT